MPRGEWDDNSWYDEGEFPPASRREGRSAMVAAAVFSFVMGGFNALGASGFLCCFGLFALASLGNPILQVDAFMFRLWFSLAVGVTSAVSFFLQLFAGFGLVRGRHWSRTITLWLGGYSLLFAAALLAAAVYMLMLNGNDDDGQQFAVMMIGTAVLHAAYAIVEFSLLLQPSVARRYR